MLKQKINRGFTIIEILVVIIIIIIFVFIAWPNITNWIDKRDTEKASFEIIKKIKEVKSKVDRGQYGMAMIHFSTPDFKYATLKIHSMSMEDYKKQYKIIGNDGKTLGGRDAKARTNCNYSQRRQPWKREEVWQQKSTRHWMNVWMCLSREGTIQGSVEARHPDTGAKLVEIYFCSIKTTTIASGGNRCNSGNKNANRYRMQWNPATDIWLYKYNDKNDKWIFTRRY